jgi:hypothetical protein
MSLGNDGDAQPEWIVVCVGCLRIKRGGQWTKERAADTNGQSAGFCDRCLKLERKRLREAAAITTMLRSRGPLSE